MDVYRKFSLLSRHLILLWLIRRRRSLVRKWMIRLLLNQQKRGLTVLSKLRGQLESDFETSKKENNLWLTMKKKFIAKDWLEHFRVRRNIFFYLVNEIKPHIKHSNEKLNAIACDKKIAIALWKLALGKSDTIAEKLFSVPKNNISAIVNDICSAIMKVFMKKLVKVPANTQLRDITEEFECDWNVPQCAGIIGCIHIPVSVQPEMTDCYKNKDGLSSIILQAVVDPSYKFWDLSIGCPGNMSEADVLMNSSLWTKGNEGNLFPDHLRKIEGVNIPILLIGDSSYPLTDWLIKPYDDNLTEEQVKFNQQLKELSTYFTATAFKRLRARWQYLVHCQEIDLNSLSNIIAACCILHNICESHNEPFLEEWNENLKTVNLFKNSTKISSKIVIGDRPNEIRQALTNYVNDFY